MNHIWDKNKKCLPVINFGILYVVVVCNASTAYISLSRGLVFYLILSLFGWIFVFQCFFLSQKLTSFVCIINRHNLKYWYVRCNCKLWNAIWFYCVFFGYFHSLLTSIRVCSVVSPLNFHRLCVLLMYTFWYVNMPNETAGYGYYMFETL